jgi:hypothetical protein
VSLNVAQRRVVLVTLQRLERALADQEQLLRPEAPLSLNQRVLDVSRQTAATLNALSDEARAAIEGLARQFGLPASKESVRRILQGTLSVMWADLEDTRPEKLRGYGPVDPSAAAELAPVIDRLIALVQAMQSAIEQDRLIEGV